MNLKEGYNEYSVIINRLKMYFRCKYIPDTKEVILFLHALACSLDSFQNILDYEYFPNKSLLLLDLVGFGKSSKSEEYSYTMVEQAQLVEKLLTILPQWNIHVVAHSMGGAIALLFNPKLFSCALSFSNIEGNLVSEDCGALSRGVASISFDDYQNDLYKKQLIEFRGHQQLLFEETNPTAVFRNAVSLVKWSDSGELLKKFRNLSCKKSYFYGEANKDMPILAQLNFVQKYIIKNSGHAMMTENPKEFYSKLVSFIESE